ncbi:MAG TPA: AtpZ/AtpI family protein [Candidatus Angelobacter sp.]|nr:AtpZ/AtpI family protein [Candidatus Angelobacter sp.]
MASPPADKNGRKENTWMQFGRYSHLALALPACVVVGLAIGAGLDHWLKTTWITLAGLGVGCVAGFTELIRSIVRTSKEP